MKKLHYRRENYPVTFKWIKPDDYFDGELIRKSWYFSVCDWFGNEIEGFDDENEMLEYWEQLTDEELEDIQIFAYPLVDDWSPVNKIDNLNRDFFVLCHD